jgi:hypothetical protein
MNDIAGKKVNFGPPFSAMNYSPSISNVTVITEPFGRPETPCLSIV